MLIIGRINKYNFCLRNGSSMNTRIKKKQINSKFARALRRISSEVQNDLNTRLAIVCKLYLLWNKSMGSTVPNESSKPVLSDYKMKSRSCLLATGNLIMYSLVVILTIRPFAICLPHSFFALFLSFFISQATNPYEINKNYSDTFHVIQRNVEMRFLCCCCCVIFSLNLILFRSVSRLIADY